MTAEWTYNDNSNSTVLDFNLSEVETAPELLPPGEYPVACTRTRVTTSKNNPATKFAELEETVLDGSGKGRKVWSRYIVAHERGDVMARGRRDLATAARAYGVPGNDLADFVGREVIVSIQIEAGTGGYGDKNKVSKRRASTGAAMSGTVTTSTEAPKPAAAKAAPPSFLAKRKTS